MQIKIKFPKCLAIFILNRFINIGMNNLIKQYDKNKFLMNKQDIKECRKTLHELIKLYNTNNSFYIRDTILCLYKGVTDKYFIHGKIYSINILQYKRKQKHEIAWAMTENGIKYIILDKCGYKFIQIGNDIDEIAVYNSRHLK